MKFQTISYDAPAENIREIRLNRPEALNAIYEPVIEELTAALQEAAGERDTRVIILSGEGRTFCAGADYKKHAARPASDRPAYLHGLVGICREIYTNPKPIVAAVHGFGVGMGAEMAVNCDFIVMTDDAFIRFPEIGIGTFVGGGVTNLLPRIIGLNRAREVLMMGKPITAAEAFAIGLANKIVPTHSFRADVLRFAEQLTQQAPVPVLLAKKALNSNTAGDYDQSFRIEHDGVLTCMSTSDWHEGVNAFAEKRRPTFTGS
jgi:enoyl-CoA hydratase